MMRYWTAMLGVVVMSNVCVCPAATNELTQPVTWTSNMVTELLRMVTASEVRDEKGAVVPLFSAEAYRAEFRYLQKTYHALDLKAPAVKTDGWTTNIPDAEWPFMGLCYFGYACANLAHNDPVIREEALAEMRWLIEALQQPRLTGFVASHFGEPFGKDKINVAVFVHGHFLNLAIRYREVSGDQRYDQLIHRVAAALAQAFAGNEQAILKSYRTMWWISDNCPALSALARYDRIFQRDSSKVSATFLKSVKAHYLDKPTGMIATYVDADKRQMIQGPRGVSMMYALHFLKDIDAGFARDQYALAKKHFIRETMGIMAVLEYPEGTRGVSDVDSGPLIMGFGPSASGFAIAACAQNGDAPAARRIANAAAAAGTPVYSKGTLRYTAMPPVGQSVILFGKTLLDEVKK